MTNQNTICQNPNCITHILEAVTEAAKAALESATCSFCGSKRLVKSANTFEQLGRATAQSRSQRAGNLY